MSATQKTINYQLPIFVGTDIPSWLTDFNSAMNKIDVAIKGASTTGGVTKDYVDGIRDELQSSITQLSTKVNNLESTIAGLKSTLENALVIGTATAGVTADQYDKIKNVSFK
jgi:hypothetical protein|nr:MAG TPA: major outer membrane lipoprotein [Caudoviricetes sp.]